MRILSVVKRAFANHPLWLPLLLVVVVYLGSYAALRRTRVLMRLGWYMNAVDVDTGEHTPGSGWRDLVITATRPIPPAALRFRAREVHPLDFLYAPLIKAECAFHDRFGLEPSANPLLPCCHRRRWQGRAVITAGVLALAASFFAPPLVQRSLRRRAGRCVACGYDRRGHAVNDPCPECGRRGRSRRA